jgi:hypothetical protein
MLATALGQSNQTKPVLQANIPFQFLAANRTFSAGNYSFKLSRDIVQMTNRDTNESVYLPLLTRIAEMKLSGTAKISFDVRDGKHFIEALWPGDEDGYLLHTVKGEHTHQIIKTM